VLWADRLLLSTPLTCASRDGKVRSRNAVPRDPFRDTPPLDPPVRLYHDFSRWTRTSGNMLTAYLKDHSLEQTYDDLLLPVLAMAEQDRHRDR